MKTSIKYILLVLGLICLPFAVAKKPGGGGAPRDQPAEVTIYNYIDDQMEVPSLICSDSPGISALYTDGFQGVTCFIGRREGMLVLKTASPRSSSGRKVCVLTDIPTQPSTEPCNSNELSIGDCKIAKVGTPSADCFGGIDLRTMEVGIEKDVALLVDLYYNKRNWWRIWYGEPSLECVPTPIEGSIPAKITATKVGEDGKASCWEIIAGEGEPPTNATVFRYPDWETACGIIYAPIRMKVELLP